MTDREIVGEEVIALPGQSLTGMERRLLLGLAEGEAPNHLSQALNIPVPDLRDIESSAQRKLGARSRGHLITRAFILGVLQPRALTACACLAVVATCMLVYAYLHNNSSNALQSYDTWAGQSQGPAAQDPRYNGKHY